MQKLTVLFNTGRETLLDISKLPPPKHHEGSTFVESKIIPLDEIYISLGSKENRNSVRAGDVVNVPDAQKLAAGIDNKGIIYEYQPPYAFLKDNTCPTTGRKYKYELLNVGNHRMYALKSLGATHWVFNVYEGSNDKFLLMDMGADTNNFDHQTIMNKASYIEMLSEMVSKKRWGKGKTQDELKTHMEDWLLKYASSFHGNTKGAIIKAVFQANSLYTDHLEYTPKDSMRWVDNYTDRKHSGEFDNSRKVNGYICGEGYEREKALTFALRKFGETGVPYEFVGHVKSPVLDNKSLCTTALKRAWQKDQFELVYSDLDKLFEFKQKHGVYPFKLVAQIAQDRLNEEDMEKEVLV